nr:integrase, catalytic region, zinc finger, CCHC-type, peptidase aspartic, catalytic [Tanacetum cinerariifolium]
WSRHVTIVHQTKDLHTADYTKLYDFLKYNQKEVDELKAERLAKTQDPLALMANSNNPYAFPAPHQDQSSFNQNYLQQPMPNPKDITDLTTAMNMALTLMAKAFKLNYSSPTNNSQRISSNPRNRQIAQPGMNMGQDRQMQMNIRNQVIKNVVQNPRVQHIGNHNGWAKWKPDKVLQMQGVGHYARNCTVRPRRRDAAYLQTQLLISQKEEAGIQLQAEEYDLMAAAADIDEIEKVNPDCILMANLQQASTSGTQIDITPIYDSDGSAEEAAKFVGDFKSLANEADASLAKHKALELEIKRLLKAVVKRFENCIIKKENEYAKLWNDWYKKCDECKYDKISYDKAYKDMLQKIERLQAQLGDLKGKSKDNSCVSDTCNPLSQNLENKNVELEFQVLNYARENAKLRTQLFKKVSDQKENTHDTSENTKFAKQPIVKNLPKVGESHALSKPVTSNSVSTPQESKGNTKTRRPQPRSNTKHDRVPSASKSSRSQNKEAEVEEHYRNLLLSKNNKHMSSACNNIKLDSQDVISKVVCAMCKQCLISVNHDVCLRNYVNGKKSRGKKQKAKVSFKENQKKYQPKVTKPKKVGILERLATPKPRKPKFLFRWSPTGRLFDQEGKLVASSESESQSDCSNGDNACTSNAMEPKIKQFPNSTSLPDRNLEGVDLLKGDRSTNLYTINLHEMASASPICLMVRASSTKSWLWHQRLSHLNFDTINDLARNDLVSGLP